MAMLARAGEWSDSEVTKVTIEAPPKRVRPACLDDVAPSVWRAVAWATVRLCIALIVLWGVKLLCLA